MQRYRPRALTVIFDDHCAFCDRCVQWLRHERCYVPLTFLPLHASETRAQFPKLSNEINLQRFIVIDDRGGVYLESAGRLMCLYATVRYRQLAMGLSKPIVKPIVSAIMNRASQHRYFISWLLGLNAIAPQECRDTSCSAK